MPGSIVVIKMVTSLLSSRPTIPTRLEPRASIVNLLAETSWTPFWSQSSTKSSGILKSFLFSLIVCRNFLEPSKSYGKFHAVFVAFRLMNPILCRKDLAQDLSRTRVAPNSGKSLGSVARTMPSAAAMQILPTAAEAAITL